MKAILLIFVVLALVGVTTASTQEEFETWLELDTTNEHEYINGTYMCIQFSDDLIKNASAAGHDVYMVGLNYQDGPGHALMSVTFDNGFVEFYDAASDIKVSEYLVEHYPNDTLTIYQSGYIITDTTQITVLSPWYEGTITGGWTERSWL